jgi:hypothetical protein
VTTKTDLAARRVTRLLRWYPRSWRARYGEEFAELLLAELAEQPRSRRRSADIIRSGLLARCTTFGLTSHELPPAQQIRYGVATLSCALAGFLALGVAMLAQLATGWQWYSPHSAPVTTGTVIMALAVGCLALAVVAAAAPVAWQAIVALVRLRDRRLAWPAFVATCCAVTLAAGARHFENGWPGTGGTGAEHGLVPGGLAAFGWASTLSVSSFWAHPAMLSRFPVTELAWMALSPLAGIGLVAGLALLLRRLVLPTRVARYLVRVATVSSAAAALFLAGAASWVLVLRPGESALAFRPGAVDDAELMLMVLTLAVAVRAVAGIRRARQALTLPG